MSYKEKIIQELRKGYTIDAISPKSELNTIYEEVFMPIINRSDLTFLIELFETNNPILRAWSFLGIHQLLHEKGLDPGNLKSSIERIIKDLLNDHRDIYYFGGSCEIQTSLREHHVSRISDLDLSIVFNPTFEYCMSFEGKTDFVLGELLENVISHSNDLKVIKLLLKRASNVLEDDFAVRLNIIKACENLVKISDLEDKNAINSVFKGYLANINNDKSEFVELNDAKKALISNQKKKLRETIFKVAAVIDLDLEKETLEFLDSLTQPFSGLKHIAMKYKKNDTFKKILLNKLETAGNPNLIIDILKAIIVLKEEIENWNELVLENVEKYNLVDENLIIEMHDAHLLTEKMMMKYFSGGKEWHLNYIRKLLNNIPDLFDEWTDLRSEFISILESFNDDENFQIKKELVLKVILDLEKRDLVPSCLVNFMTLKNEDLKKLCLFAIINYGSKELWAELKKYLIENEEEKAFFQKFWRYIKTREWKYYY